MVIAVTPPHGAFELTGVDKIEDPRESIEARLIVATRRDQGEAIKA
jgi:hypothetical protein